MQSLRDHLLKAGLVTEEQAARAAAPAKGARHAKNKKKHSGGNPPEKGNEAKAKGQSKPRPRMGLGRSVDLSNPKTLKILQAIEEHRVRSETKGEVTFHFTLRDGRVRKMFVANEISRGLESGRLAIVENGNENEHVIVAAEALVSIREQDREAVRFHAS